MKIILLSLLLVAIVMCQPNVVVNPIYSKKKVGGFTQLTQDKLLMYQNENDDFKIALEKAKAEYLSTHNDNLGELIKAS